MRHSPRVHITAAPLAGAVFVLVEHDADDDCRGGRLTLPLSALEQLPAAIESAVSRYRTERAQAAG